MGENADQEKDIIDIILDVPLAKQEQILEYYLS